MSRSIVAPYYDSAVAAASSAVDGLVTISCRLPILARYAVAPTADGLAEWHDAIGEKVAAAAETVEAAAQAWQDLAWRALAGPFTPFGMVEEARVMAEAVSEPGRRRMRANAARFGRG